MQTHLPRYYFEHLAEDIPAGNLASLVSLPLSLGIALASGAPLLSGSITGIIAGLVISWLSGSQLSVSCPAAGLTIIVAQAIQTLGSYPVFLSAVMRAGVIGAYFTNAVIKGMLAAIDLILILRQILHAVGYGAGFEGDEAFFSERRSHHPDRASPFLGGRFSETHIGQRSVSIT